MYGLSPRKDGCAYDLIFVEIAGGSLRAAYAVALVRQGHMKGVPVCLGIYGHRRYAHLLAGSYDPDGDLAPVSYKYL